MHGHLFGRLGLALGLALAPQQGTPEPLAEPGIRLKLRAAAGEIAKTGDAALVARMREVLVVLGDDPDELGRLVHAWEKTAASAKPGRARGAAAKGKVRQALEPLAQRLTTVPSERRETLAHAILALDSANPDASAALGRIRQADGDWLTEEEQAWRTQAGRVAELVRRAGALEIEIKVEPSNNPALAQVCGGGSVARAFGVEIHSHLAPVRLERILRQALRTVALSQALLFDRLEVPSDTRAQSYVFLDSRALFRPALEEARKGGGISEEGVQETLKNEVATFYDSRGWMTMRWCPEAQFEAALTWWLLYPLLHEVPPCLRAGHVNWICLALLGTGGPAVAWREERTDVDAGRTAARTNERLLREALWRSAQHTLQGCRSWMIQAVREKRDPPWTRSMLDQEGKIVDENLLKTTLVCEMLQVEQRLWDVMDASRNATTLVPKLEETLGEALPEFEDRWRRWLDDTRQPGVLQELERADPETDDPFAAALAALNGARAAALDGQDPEMPVVALDPELCRAAALHARYLTRNAEQKKAWPDAHEEYSDRPGFTPAGCLAGGRSVIAFDGDPVNSVQSWLDTFFHRLPLLDPGLFGAGFGTDEEVVVLDVCSLVLAPWKDHVVVWPVSGAKDVPRRMSAELPNPVPGADQTELGYPITVQLFLPHATEKTELELELFAGTPEPRNLVECHRISPEAPLQPELAPENVWALIPERPLAKKTAYTARAKWAGQTKVWTFTTGG